MLILSDLKIILKNAPISAAVRSLVETTTVNPMSPGQRSGAGHYWSVYHPPRVWADLWLTFSVGETPTFKVTILYLWSTRRSDFLLFFIYLSTLHFFHFLLPPPPPPPPHTRTYFTLQSYSRSLRTSVDNMHCL